MGIARRALLYASESPWWRERLATTGVARRAVRRFMPGEELSDALAAAVVLRQQGAGVVLTRLGESVHDATRAEEAARHYERLWPDVRALGLDAQVSVKLTQLGLDRDEALCLERVCVIADAAGKHGAFLWIDMEQARYLERTLGLYQRVLHRFSNVGVCLQAYLRRTEPDLKRLVSLGGGIRLVKGAYKEPADTAHQSAADIDLAFLKLSEDLLRGARDSGCRVVFGTHDGRMIEGVKVLARQLNVESGAFEFHLLFGINRPAQRRLVDEGYRVRVLISYGRDWYPWYMRRLAERPSNLLLAAKALVGR